MKKIIILFFLVNLFSCSLDDVKYDYPKDPGHAQKNRAGKYFKDDVTLYKYNNRPRIQSTSPGADNNKLWVASLEVIGKLLPIVGADEPSGMIITDWYQDKNKQDQRMKINFLVKSGQIQEDSLVVYIFRQGRGINGAWFDIVGENDDPLVHQIKRNVVDRAKNLNQSKR